MFFPNFVCLRLKIQTCKNCTFEKYEPIIDADLLSCPYEFSHCRMDAFLIMSLQVSDQLLGSQYSIWSCLLFHFAMLLEFIVKHENITWVHFAMLIEFIVKYFAVVKCRHPSNRMLKHEKHSSLYHNDIQVNEQDEIF